MGADGSALCWGPKANQLPQIQREKYFSMNEFKPIGTGFAWDAFLSEDEEGGRVVSMVTRQGNLWSWVGLSKIVKTDKQPHT